MKDLVETLSNLNLTISSCESFTGGLFASSLTSISGVSKVYKGSLVTYNNELKEELLGIEHKLIEDLGVINEKVALHMAKRTLQLTNSDYCVSFTGNAGPIPMEGKAVGLCYISVVSRKSEFVSEYRFKGSRNRIRRNAVNKACRIIMELLRKELNANVL